MDNGKKSCAGRLTFGMLIICIGITLILNNTGYLSWSIWNHLISYWPVLLIIAGINVIFERSAAQPLTYLSPLIIVGLFGFVIYSFDPTAEETKTSVLPDFFKPDTKYESDFVVNGYKPEDIELVSLEINGGAGAIDFKDWDECEPDDVAKIIAETTGFTPKLKETLDDGVLAIELSDDNTRAIRQGGHDYKIKLSPDYVYDLVINTGAGDLSFDLFNSRVESMEINSGAAEVQLITPASGEKECDIEINSGASEIKIEVPEGVTVDISKNGLGVISADDLVEDSGLYSNPDEDGETPYKVSIEVNNAVGTISLKPYTESFDKDDSSESDAAGENTEVKTESGSTESGDTSAEPDKSDSGDAHGDNSEDTDNPLPAWFDSISHRV